MVFVKVRVAVSSVTRGWGSRDWAEGVNTIDAFVQFNESKSIVDV